MKTKNAFALRDFDPAHILQRPFFRDFHFDTNKSDAQILESLSIVNEDYVEAWERNLYVIKATHERLIEFRNLINKHNETRLSKYNKKILTRENTSDSQRSVHVIEYFNASLSILELINKFKQLYCDIEKKIQIRYRKDFAQRVKHLRQESGLTQKQLGDLVQISPQVFSTYERGERDVPIHTIIRLARILNVSSDQILGIV